MDKENQDAGVGTTATGTGAVAEPTTTEPTTRKTLDELLSEDKEYQSEYDKKVTQAMNTRIANERIKWEEEQKSKLAEAERFAKMSEDEKQKELLGKETARADKAERDLNAYKLKDETIRQANSRGIPIELVQTLDFNSETAESLQNKLAIFEKTFKSERAKTINEYSKEDAPQTGERAVTKNLKDMSYDELSKYFEEHPNENV